jgi:hypothetical protein
MTYLTYVTNSCINMTYGSRQRCPESQASEPRSGLAASVRSIARCRCAIGAGLCHFSTASLSIPAAGRALESTSPSERIQAGIHGETSTQFDSAGAVVRIWQEDLDQRSREPGAVGAPATRARSWLNRSRFKHTLFSGSIVSIVCCQRSCPKLIRCWYRINASRSQLRSPYASRKPRR